MAYNTIGFLCEACGHYYEDIPAHWKDSPECKEKVYDEDGMKRLHRVYPLNEEPDGDLEVPEGDPIETEYQPLCEACGAPMESQRSSRRFCSDKCRKHAKRIESTA